MVRLIRLVANLLHVLWIKRCKLIHAKVVDETEVKEFNDLKQEFEEVLSFKVCKLLIEKGKVRSPHFQYKAMII